MGRKKNRNKRNGIHPGIIIESVNQTSSNYSNVNVVPTNTPPHDFHVPDLSQEIFELRRQLDCALRENHEMHLIISQNHGAPHFNDWPPVMQNGYNERFSAIVDEIIFDLSNDVYNEDELREQLTSLRRKKQEYVPPVPSDELFALDCSAAEASNVSSIPHYDTSFNVLHNGDLVEEEKKSKKRTAPRYSCFNCGGDHHVKNCLKKINFRRVTNAKKNLSSSNRYHLQESIQESSFQPGKLSSNLRNALGLRKNEIPMHIYAMRVIEYPPGWVSHAAVEVSGLALYGKDGAPENNMNGNERSLNIGGIKAQINCNELIDYPGFNIRLPSDTIDACFELGFPPMQDHQLRSVIEQNVPKADTCPNRKRKWFESSKNSPKKHKVEDMDIENEDDTDSIMNPPLPPDDGTFPPPPPPPLIDSDETSSSTENLIESSLDPNDSKSVPENPQTADDTTDSLTSLEELEKMKMKLQEELCDSTGSQSPSLFTSEVNVISTPKQSCEKNSHILQRSESFGGGSKSVMLGTPSLTRHSSFSKLPSYDNFAKDVTEHMNFENLPNSTGTYERMKQVLKRVKSKVKSLMN